MPSLKFSDSGLPYYIIYESQLRKNLESISQVAKASGASILIAFKANAAWKTFPIIREYVRDFAASSPWELQLGLEELGGEAHLFSPAYSHSNIQFLLQGASHIVFNSLSQLQKFGPLAKQKGVEIGLRVNPECSVIETDLYNPALPGSRLGVPAAQLPALPQMVSGLHFHALCESSSYDLEKVLSAFELKFSHFFPQLRWVNFGGGHLITREGYDKAHLISLIKDFRERHPDLKVYLEPGSAWTWRTGDLIAHVVDVVTNGGVNTAILDVSFSCHMPDCLEMPYTPIVTETKEDGPYIYKFGGSTCLNGDVCPGTFSFDHELIPGETLTFQDMNHYTNVKTTMFNGVTHPDMVLCRENGDLELLRHYDFNDYKSRMD